MPAVVSYDRDATPLQKPLLGPAQQWRGALAGPVVALVSLGLAAVVTRSAGVPLRDPDGVASGRLLVAAALVGALVLVDVLVRAARRSGRVLPTAAALVAVRRERWTRVRVLTVALAVLSFFVTYFAYRNLKSVVPLVRPVLFDEQLASLDRDLFAGHDPASVLHAVLGSGVAADALSTVYLLLFLFIPVSLAFALVFSRDLRAGLLFSTAFSANWLLGAGSYFLLPSLGPVYADPGVFTHLPVTAVTHLQTMLLDDRIAFLRDPYIPGAAQSIGAFASLHVSIYATAALTAHVLRMPRALKMGLWGLTALTAASTVYFGWHYLADDAGGLVIAVLAMGIARAITGFGGRAA